MTIVPIGSITVDRPNRQRREFDEAKIRQLADAIQKRGLQNAIVVDDFTSLRLTSGERRLRAISSLTTPYRHNGTLIPVGHVPCTQLPDLSEADRYEAELDENLHRDNLTWKEQTDAIARLHELRAGQKAAVGEKQTFTATAVELKGDTPVTTHDLTIVRNATLLKPFLADPDVAKASSEKEALSIVRRKLTQEFQATLAKNFDLTKANTPHTLVHGSLLEKMTVLPDGTFDCIIVDPPYGIDAHKMTPMSNSSSGVKHEYEDTFENAYTVWECIFSEGARVCKAQAHLYMFFDYRHAGVVSALAKAAGWDVAPYPIIWHKPGGGNLGDSTRWPRRSYETILFARRGDRRVTGVYVDVIVANSVDAGMHGAAKPVDVYTNLLRRSCVAGDRVLDPCAGSGTLFPAANKLRLIATGIEISHVHYSTALQRLKEQ